MSGADATDGGPAKTPVPDEASVPEGLVSAVVNLVNTGPVFLGAYTVAELTVVDAIIDFLEARPSDEVLAEAVRSLAARQLIVPGSDGQQIRVRGDLGIAVAFQQRARRVLDARVTGVNPGEPWRVLMLPQPEQICLMVRIDALGVHEIGLYKLDEALEFLTNWLPKGSLAEHSASADADSVLAGSQRSGLVTVTGYTTKGSEEIAGMSTDLVLARRDDKLHVYSRDPNDRAKLLPSKDGEHVDRKLAELLA